MIKKLRIGLFLLISLALVAFFIAGVYSENFPPGSVSGQASTQKINVKSPSSEKHADTGFIGPVINIPKEKEEILPESIDKNPPFDSIRPFPGSLLPHHIDSMWFYVSNRIDWGETLDSIHLIIRGKVISLLPIDDGVGFFNTLKKNLINHISFRNMTQNGLEDILVHHWASGATGNNVYSVFLFNDVDTTYIYNEELSQFTNINVDKEGFYYTLGKGGWGNYGGQIMVLDSMDEGFQLRTIVSYAQDWSPDPPSSDFYQILNFYFDTLNISYVDTFPNHLRPRDFNDFQNVFHMNSRVKYYNPKIHCTPNTEDDPLPDCTFTFQSRLKDHKIQILSDLKNMRLKISDEGSFDPVVLDIEINKNNTDFELTSSYLRAALSFYENWRSEPGLYLFIRSVNIELIDLRNDNNYDYNKPLQLL